MRETKQLFLILNVYGMYTLLIIFINIVKCHIDFLFK